MCDDCVVLHDRLGKQAYELFQLKRANTNLHAQLRYERRRNGKLTKELLQIKQPKQHYRNGQKRGRTRNG